VYLLAQHNDVYKDSNMGHGGYRRLGILTRDLELLYNMHSGIETGDWNLNLLVQAESERD
jgi:hypothetical protein